MKTIEQVVRDFRRSMGVMAIFSLAANILLLILPLYLLQIYDRILPSRSGETLVFLTILAVLGLFTLGSIEVVRTVLANRAAARLDVSLSDATLRSILRFGSRSGGNVQPLRDIATLRGLLSSRVVFALLDLPFATLFIALMYLLNPVLFWITLGGAAVVTAIALANQYVSGRVSRKQNELTIRAGLNAEQLARNADSVIAMGMLGNTVNRWGHDHAASLKTADAVGTINAWFSGLSRTIRLCLQIAILGVGALLVLKGEMSAGMIFASSLISGRGLQPIDQVIGSWRQLVGGWEAWRRVRVFLEKAPGVTMHTSLSAPKGALAVSGLVQQNPADPTRPPILRNVSFNVEPGEAVAVIGPSGAGKSTLARILVSGERPRSGEVRIDTNNIANWDPEELGRHIGYLAQDVELIPGTIAENIARFEPDAKDEDIVEAARRAHAEELIARMPKGYDTYIGPGGIRPSGGEKQRIALARAFYGNPCLLVLDEPNANLDTQGESALQEALIQAKQAGVTVFAITQRPTLLPIADKILLLKDGMVGDFGPRDEVLERLRQSVPSNPAQGQSPAASPDKSSAASSRFVSPMRASIGSN